MTGQAPGSELVMGAAIGHPVDRVRPFLTSLRRAGYRGPVALFVDRGLERQLRGDPLAAGVMLIRAGQWLPFRLGMVRHARAMRLLWVPLQAVLWAWVELTARLPLSAERRWRLRRPLAQLVCSPMDGRFLRYRQFLKAHPYDRVLLSDVRDVLFQNDPFSALPATGLAVGIESPSYTIGTDARNAAWVKRAYGAAMLSRIGRNPVSCVGVTYGDREALAGYLELMTDQLLSLSPSEIGIAGADTAVHNVLLWTNRLGPVHRLETLSSPIATLNGIDEQQLELTPRDRVLNPDGSEPSVVHQYDRFPGVGPRLLRALAG